MDWGIHRDPGGAGPDAGKPRQHHSSIDALPFSLDDVSTGTLAIPAIFDDGHMLSLLSGSVYLEAILETSEKQMDEARRVRVQGFRPLTDTATCYGSIGGREKIQDTVVYSSEQIENAGGLCPSNYSTRLARGRLRIPAGTLWTFAQGIEPFFTIEGKR